MGMYISVFIRYNIFICKFFYVCPVSSRIARMSILGDRTLPVGLKVHI